MAEMVRHGEFSSNRCYAPFIVAPAAKSSGSRWIETLERIMAVRLNIMSGVSRAPTEQGKTVKNRSDTQEPIDRLQRAIKALEADATRAELWAAILSGWAKPVPSYEPDDKFRLVHAAKRVPKAAATGRR